MSNEKMFSKKEVQDMMVSMHSLLTHQYTGMLTDYSWYDEEPKGYVFGVSPVCLYKTMYGQAMSVLESTVDAGKLEASKTVLRQLFVSARQDATNEEKAKLRCMIEGLNESYGPEWDKLKEKIGW